jgi:hypothetical protein
VPWKEQLRWPSNDQLEKADCRIASGEGVQHASPGVGPQMRPAHNCRDPIPMDKCHEPLLPVKWSHRDVLPDPKAR